MLPPVGIVDSVRVAVASPYAGGVTMPPPENRGMIINARRNMTPIFTGNENLNRTSPFQS